MANFIGNVLFVIGVVWLVCIFPWLIPIFVVLFGMALASK